MKKMFVTCLLAGFAGFVLFPAHAAQGGHGAHADHGGHAGAPVAVSAEDSLVDGTVKKIDKASGKITLAHGPLTNLNMPHAMTMAFRVKDLTWLDQMRVGDRIRFVADSVGGALTIVRFEAVK